MAKEILKKSLFLSTALQRKKNTNFGEKYGLVILLSSAEFRMYFVQIN